VAFNVEHELNYSCCRRQTNDDYYLRASSSLTPDNATRNVDANADGGKQIERGEERKKERNTRSATGRRKISLEESQ
jgi:hypothetical protein